MPHGTATRHGIRPGSVSTDPGPDGSRVPGYEGARMVAANHAQSSDPDVPHVVLGLRLLALAVVAGSGALLPIGA